MLSTGPTWSSRRAQFPAWEHSAGSVLDMALCAARLIAHSASICGIAGSVDGRAGIDGFRFSEIKCAGEINQRRRAAMRSDWALPRQKRVSRKRNTEV